MQTGLSNSLKKLNVVKNTLEQEKPANKINTLMLDINNKNTTGASFTVSKEVYLKIDNLAKHYKSTKTDIVEALIRQVYSQENESLTIEIEKKEKVQRKPINLRLDKKYDKALKKLSNETNKTYGEILTEILDTIE